MESQFGHYFISVSIIAELRIMNSAIELNDQLLFSTIEIRHIELRTVRGSSKNKRMLSQKFESPKLSVAEMLPNEFLFWCLVSS